MALTISPTQPADDDLDTWAGITPAANVGTFLATPSSANLAAAMTDETGTAGNNVFSTSPTLTNITLAAGTNALAPLVFNSGTSLSSPIAGATEYDATNFFGTIDTTSGQGAYDLQQVYRITANLGTRSSSDYFDSNSAFPTVANGIYELNWYLYFLKTSNGNVTWTILHSQNFTNLVASWFSCAAGGISATSAMATAGIVTTTTASAALPACASMTGATNQFHQVRALAECGTAGNVRLRVTVGAGTITPLRGSYFTARRLYAGNVGTFVA
jgi:hypothetical protein